MIMAKTEKKVSISRFDKIAKEHFNNDVVIPWHEAEVRVKRSLPLTEVLAFADDVVESCFHEKYGYMPELRDFAIKANILSRYANFALPDDLEHRYRMVYYTDAVDTVCDAVNATQLQEIADAIDEKIQFRLDTMSSEVKKRLDRVVRTIEDMGRQTEALFSGISKDDIKNLASAIAGSKLDERKLVKAFVEQRKGANAAGIADDAGAPEQHETIAADAV